MENPMKMDDDWGYPYFRRKLPLDGFEFASKFNDVTVTITVIEAVFSRLIRKLSSDARKSHACKQT